MARRHIAPDWKHPAQTYRIPGRVFILMYPARDGEPLDEDDFDVDMQRVAYQDRADAFAAAGQELSAQGETAIHIEAGDLGTMYLVNSDGEQLAKILELRLT